MSKYGVSVWGIGNHARQRILPKLISCNELYLIGVCSRSEKKVNLCANEFSCIGWTNPDDMLSNEELKVVYISSPIGVHFEMAKMILDTGKNVWCEKPLTCNLSHTNQLIEKARESKRMIAEAFMFFYHPQFQIIKNLVVTKEFGEIYSVVCRFEIPNLDFPGFRNKKKLCGGAFWDVGSYPVAAVLDLFESQNVEVLFSQIIKNNESEVDSFGRAILQFSEGATAYIEWGVGSAYKNELDILAENGSIYTDKIFSKPDNYMPKLRVRNKFGDESYTDVQKSDQFVEMFKEFTKISKSSIKIEKEYNQIYRRAKVMNEILELSKLT